MMFVFRFLVFVMEVFFACASDQAGAVIGCLVFCRLHGLVQSGYLSLVCILACLRLGIRPTRTINRAA